MIQIDIVQSIFSGIMVLGVMALVICGPIAIIFSVLARSEQDPVIKQKNKKRAKWIILVPLLSIVAAIILWVIISIARNFIG